MDQFNSQRQPGEESNRTKSVEVTKQAILYVAAWLVVMIPMSIDTVAITFLSNGDYSEVPLPNWYHGEWADVWEVHRHFLFGVSQYRCHSMNSILFLLNAAAGPFQFPGILQTEVYNNPKAR